jgi:hypothetical protein
MMVRNSDGLVILTLTNEVSGGITVLNPPTDGIFKIDSQIVDIEIGNHVYDIEITFANGDVRTYVSGNWLIYQDISYEEVEP